MSSFEQELQSLLDTLQNLEFQFTRIVGLRNKKEAMFSQLIDSPETEDLEITREALDLINLGDDEKLILAEKLKVFEKFLKENIEAFKTARGLKEKSEAMEKYQLVEDTEKKILGAGEEVDELLKPHIGRLTELYTTNKNAYDEYKKGLSDTVRNALGKNPSVTFYLNTRMQIFEMALKRKEFVPANKETVTKIEPVIEPPVPTIVEETIQDPMTLQEPIVTSTAPKSFKNKQVKELFIPVKLYGQSKDSFKIFVRCPECKQQQIVTAMINRCWQCNNFHHLTIEDTKEDREYARLHH